MKKNVNEIIQQLKVLYPDALCALQYEKDYELMIAVRLSAQCTDARVNLVTPALFEAYPTLEDMANAPIEDVERHIHSCGFFRQKAKDIVGACQIILTKFDGKVPDTMEALLSLPGVGRKTANLLLGDLYGQAGSIVCDTHCIRICGRLGLSKGKDPERWKSSSARSCHRRKAMIFVTESSCLDGISVPQGHPSVIDVR